MPDALAPVRNLERNMLPALVLRLEAMAPKGLFRFLSVGVGGLSVDIAILWLLEGQGMGHELARLISIGIATVFTWTLNRHFTFGLSGRRARIEFSRYALVALVAQSVNYTAFLVICDLFSHIPHPLAAFMGAVIATGFSYTGQRFFTFARKRVASPKEG